MYVIDENQDWYINFLKEIFLKFYPKKVPTVSKKGFRGEGCPTP